MHLREFLKSNEPEQIQLRKFIRRIMYLWSLLIILSITMNVWQEYEDLKAIAENTARASFFKDQSYRYWTATHGGAYVPATERTPPNPNLAHIPDRDIVKPDGQKLTLMNPAYMLRQMMEEYPGLYGARGKITSLKYFHPGNKPDEWETQALKLFEQGFEEVLEYTKVDNQPYLRLMRPMITDETCLKCHAIQGYKIGDVRGGVGVSVPLQQLHDLAENNYFVLIFAHFGLWLAVLGSLGFFAFRQSSYLEERSKIKQALYKSEEKFRILYHNSPDMYVSVSPDNAGILLCNETLLEKTGYAREEVIGFPIFKMYHDDCLNDVKKSVFPQFVETGIVQDKELTLKRKDGSKIDVSLNVNAVKDEAGKIIQSISSWRDITERKHAEQELTKYRENLEELVKERTAELEAKNKDLDEYNKLFIGREYRIKELRDKVKSFEEKYGKLE